MFIGFRKLLAVVAIFIMLILKMRKETWRASGMFHRAGKRSGRNRHLNLGSLTLY